MKTWFQGRINRTTYTLSVIAISFLLGVSKYGLMDLEKTLVNDLFKLIISLAVLVLAVFFVGIHAKRWHDFNKSGWFAILNLIPVIGQIITIILFFVPGDPKTNKYGKKPTAIYF